MRLGSRNRSLVRRCQKLLTALESPCLLRRISWARWRCTDLDKDEVISRNPATGEVLGEVPEMAPAEISRRSPARARAARVGRAAGARAR